MLSDPAFDLSDADDDTVVLAGPDLESFLRAVAPRRRRPGPSAGYMLRVVAERAEREHEQRGGGR